MNIFNKTLIAVFAISALTSVANAQLPDPGMEIEKGHTAVLITDPQNDFLSPKSTTGELDKSDNNRHSGAIYNALMLHQSLAR